LAVTVAGEKETMLEKMRKKKKEHIVVRVAV